MRNFLRWLIGAASDASVKSLVGTLGTEAKAVDQRLNIIENIDGVNKPAELFSSPLERCVVGLSLDCSNLHGRTLLTETALGIDKVGAEWPYEKNLPDTLAALSGEIDNLAASCVNADKSIVAESTAVDNKILKRLLFAEMVLGIVPREDGLATVQQQIGRLEIIAEKMDRNNELSDQLMANVNEYRKEVKALKGWQDANGPVTHRVGCDFVDITNYPELADTKTLSVGSSNPDFSDASLVAAHSVLDLATLRPKKKPPKKSPTKTKKAR